MDKFVCFEQKQKRSSIKNNTKTKSKKDLQERKREEEKERILEIYKGKGLERSTYIKYI